MPTRTLYAFYAMCLSWFLFFISQCKIIKNIPIFPARFCCLNVDCSMFLLLLLLLLLFLFACVFAVNGISECNECPLCYTLPHPVLVHTPYLHTYLYVSAICIRTIRTVIVCPRHLIKACFVLSLCSISIDFVGSAAREATPCGAVDGGAGLGPRGCPEPGPAAAEEHQRGNYLHRYHVRTAALCGQIATLPAARQEGLGAGQAAAPLGAHYLEQLHHHQYETSNYISINSHWPAAPATTAATATDIADTATATAAGQAEESLVLR